MDWPFISGPEGFVCCLITYSPADLPLGSALKLQFFQHLPMQSLMLILALSSTVMGKLKSKWPERSSYLCLLLLLHAGPAFHLTQPLPKLFPLQAAPPNKPPLYSLLCPHQSSSSILKISSHPPGCWIYLICQPWT